MPDEALAAGTLLLGGSYRIDHLIWKGDVALVYRGEALPTGVPVAIKELFPSTYARTRIGGRLREMRPLMRPVMSGFLQHSKDGSDLRRQGHLLAQPKGTGLVRVLETSWLTDVHYMVMEFLDGQTWAATVEERGPLDEVECVQYARILGEALEELHASPNEGFLHCDVEPSNIMITPDSRAVLTGFGTPRCRVSENPRARFRFPTLGFAPIEQYSASSQLKPSSDVYGLGATLYYALTGSAPPDAVSRARGVELIPPNVIRPSLSRRTSDAIVAALELLPCRRPQTMSQLLQLLEEDSSDGATMLAPEFCSRASEAASVECKVSSSQETGSRPRFRRTNARGFREFLNEKDGTILVEIPGGTFSMGSNDHPEEGPIHQVTLTSYMIARVPVTNGQFSRFVAESGHDPGPEWKRQAHSWGRESRLFPVTERKGRHLWEKRLPVVFVDWEDASAYARWAGLRLPDEREWEYACRGPEALVYPWGSDWAAGRCQNLVEGKEGRAAVVGGFPDHGSPFGCLDMAGNVWEWTGSWYNGYPGNMEDEEDFGREKRVLRGGAWDCSKPVYFRGAFRGRQFPECYDNSIGFRVAWSAG